MYFKVIKSGTTRKLVTFAVSHTVLGKFDVKQFNDLEICPRSLTVVSPESCRVAMYVKYSEDSERMKRKSPFSTIPHSHLTPPLQRTPANMCINLILQIFEQFCPKAAGTPTHKLPSPKQILTQNGHSRSSIWVSLKRWAT